MDLFVRKILPILIIILQDDYIIWKVYIIYLIFLSHNFSKENRKNKSGFVIELGKIYKHILSHLKIDFYKELEMKKKKK